LSVVAVEKPTEKTLFYSSSLEISRKLILNIGHMLTLIPSISPPSSSRAPSSSLPCVLLPLLSSFLLPRLPFSTPFSLHIKLDVYFLFFFSTSAINRIQIDKYWFTYLRSKSASMPLFWTCSVFESIKMRSNASIYTQISFKLWRQMYQ